MASIYGGGNSFAAIAEEIVWGTPVSPRTHFRPVTSSSMNRTRDKNERNNLSVGGVSNIADGDYLVRDLAGGRVELEMTYENMGLWLKHCMGQVVDTGVGPFVHTYSRIAADTWPIGLTYAENRGASSREIYSGIRVRDFELRATVGEYLRLTMNLIGKTSDGRLDLLDTPVLATPTTLIKASDFTTLGWNATTYRLIDFTLRVDNGFDTRLLLGDLQTQQPVVKRRQTVTLDITLEVQDALHDDYLADTASDATITFDDPVSTNAFVATLSNAKFQSNADPLVDFNIVQQRLTLKGFGDTSNMLTEQGLQLVMTNSVASGTAN